MSFVSDLYFFCLYFCPLLDILILLFLCTCSEIALETFTSIFISRCTFLPVYQYTFKAWFWCVSVILILYFFPDRTLLLLCYEFNVLILLFSRWWENRQNRLSLINQLPSRVSETSGTNLCIRCLLLYNELLQNIPAYKKTSHYFS